MLDWDLATWGIAASIAAILCWTVVAASVMAKLRRKEDEPAADPDIEERPRMKVALMDAKLGDDVDTVPIQPSVAEQPADTRQRTRVTRSHRRMSRARGRP